jgi:hypothetical protein
MNFTPEDQTVVVHAPVMDALSLSPIGDAVHLAPYGIAIVMQPKTSSYKEASS